MESPNLFPLNFSAYSDVEAKPIFDENLIPSFVLVEDQAKSLRLSGEDPLAQFMDIYRKQEELGNEDQVVAKYGDECICIIRHGKAATAHVADTRKVHQSECLRKLLVPSKWGALSEAVHLDASVSDVNADVLVFVHPTHGNDGLHNLITFFAKESYLSRYLSAIRHIDSLMIKGDHRSTLSPLIRGVRSECLKKAYLGAQDKEIADSKYAEVLAQYIEPEEVESVKPGEEVEPPSDDEILKRSLNSEMTYYAALPEPDHATIDDICETATLWSKSQLIKDMIASPLSTLCKHPQGIYAIKNLTATGGHGFAAPLCDKEVKSFLNSLSSVEIREMIKRMKDQSTFSVTNEDLFVFSLKAATTLCYDLLPCSNMLDPNFKSNLNEFVGGILDKLDLTKCMITGSAIPACLYTNVRSTRTDVPRCKWFHQRIVEHYAPWNLVNLSDVYVAESDEVVYTRSSISFIAANKVEVKIFGRKAESMDDVRMVSFTADVEAGCDIDIAVDVVTDEDLYVEARSILKIVRESVKFNLAMEKVEKARGVGYRIVADFSLQKTDPHAFLTFRPVEIYKSSFARICTHHVAPVRAAYTAKFTGKPELWITATCLYSMVTGRNIHYWYFSSVKSTAARIIIKYQNRGFYMNMVGKAHEIISAEKQKMVSMHKLFLLPCISFETPNNADEVMTFKTSVLARCGDCRQHFTNMISVGIDQHSHSDVSYTLSVTMMVATVATTSLCNEVGCHQSNNSSTIRCYGHGSRTYSTHPEPNLLTLMTNGNHKVMRHFPSVRQFSVQAPLQIPTMIGLPAQMPQMIPQMPQVSIFPIVPLTPTSILQSGMSSLRPLSPRGDQDPTTCQWILSRGANCGKRCGKPIHKDKRCFAHRLTHK